MLYYITIFKIIKKNIHCPHDVIMKIKMIKQILFHTMYRS